MKSFIRVTHVYPPIKTRQYDWSAEWASHDGDTKLRGFGKNATIAVRDLLNQTIDYHTNECEDVVEMALTYWKMEEGTQT